MHAVSLLIAVFALPLHALAAKAEIHSRKQRLRVRDGHSGRKLERYAYRLMKAPELIDGLKQTRIGSRMVDRDGVMVDISEDGAVGVTVNVDVDVGVNVNGASESSIKELSHECIEWETKYVVASSKSSKASSKSGKGSKSHKSGKGSEGGALLEYRKCVAYATPRPTTEPVPLVTRSPLTATASPVEASPTPIPTTIPTRDPSPGEQVPITTRPTTSIENQPPSTAGNAVPGSGSASPVAASSFPSPAGDATLPPVVTRPPQSSGIPSLPQGMSIPPQNGENPTLPPQVSTSKPSQIEILPTLPPGSSSPPLSGGNLTLPPQVGTSNPSQMETLPTLPQGSSSPPQSEMTPTLPPGFLSSPPQSGDNSPLPPQVGTSNPPEMGTLPTLPPGSSSPPQSGSGFVPTLPPGFLSSPPQSGDNSTLPPQVSTSNPPQMGTLPTLPPGSSSPPQSDMTPTLPPGFLSSPPQSGGNSTLPPQVGTSNPPEMGTLPTLPPGSSSPPRSGSGFVPTLPPGMTPTLPPGYLSSSFDSLSTMPPDMRSFPPGGGHPIDMDFVDCTTHFCQNQLSDDYLLKYRINVPEVSDADTCDGCTVSLELTYNGEAWMAIAFSTDGQMVGSVAVIGIPGEDVPQKYILGGQSTSAVEPMPEDQQTLTDASVEVTNGQTIMKFTKKMNEPDEIEIVIGDNNFLWAYGSGAALDYHTRRESYVQNLSIATTSPNLVPTLPPGLSPPPQSFSFSSAPHNSGRLPMLSPNTINETSSGAPSATDLTTLSWDFEDGAFPVDSWTTGGDGWTIDQTQVDGGLHSIRSPDLEALRTALPLTSNATLRLADNFKGGVLKLRVFASVQPPRDVFSIYIDDESAAQLVETDGFTSVALSVSPGSHTINFAYQYNIFGVDPLPKSSPTRLGAVWIDNVVVEPLALLTVSSTVPAYATTSFPGDTMILSPPPVSSTVPTDSPTYFPSYIITTNTNSSSAEPTGSPTYHSSVVPTENTS